MTIHPNSHRVRLLGTSFLFCIPIFANSCRIDPSGVQKGLIDPRKSQDALPVTCSGMKKSAFGRSIEEQKGSIRNLSFRALSAKIARIYNLPAEKSLVHEALKPFSEKRKNLGDYDYLVELNRKFKNGIRYSTFF